ncbi:type I secretion outer membrane, TolC family protein [Burkholderia sp. ABCPW 111]|nr:type I secretion outer membrane, TolC family protein [Burkholderia sp. ABCPW 111]
MKATPNAAAARRGTSASEKMDELRFSPRAATFRLRASSDADAGMSAAAVSRFLPRGRWALLWFAFAAPAPSAHATTLPQAVAAARTFDAAISAARHGERAGAQKRWEGLAGLLPKVQLEGAYTRQDQPSASYAAGVRRHYYAITLTQPLFDLGRYADYQRGAAQASGAEVELASAQQQLVSNVSDAFFEILYQREVLQATRAAKETFGQQLERARLALNIGEGTRTDVDEAQANYDDAQAREIGALNDLETAGGAYERLTGLRAADVDPLAGVCRSPPSMAELEPMLARAEEDNLEVRAAAFQLDEAQADVTTARASHLPVVNLQGSYGGNWSRAQNGNALDELFGTTSKTRTSMIGITVTIPLFAGGAAVATSREAYSRRAQRRDQFEDARRRARQDARAAFLGIVNGAAKLRAQQRAVESARSRVESTHYGREVGLRTNVDELTAQQKYFEAARDLADARFRYITARLKLSAVLGTIAQDDLNEFGCLTVG